MIGDDEIEICNAWPAPCWSRSAGRPATTSTQTMRTCTSCTALVDNGHTTTDKCLCTVYSVYVVSSFSFPEVNPELRRTDGDKRAGSF